MSFLLTIVNMKSILFIDSNIVLTIVFTLIAVAIFVVAVILVIKSNKQFHDKSYDIKIGMNEERVMEILDKDPAFIEQLTNGNYEWVYEKKEAGRWGPTVYKTEIIFDVNKLVIEVKHSKYLEGLDSKKEI